MKVIGLVRKVQRKWKVCIRYNELIPNNSGGKDSCYNMMQCVANGHEIVALANLKPPTESGKGNIRRRKRESGLCWLTVELFRRVG